MLRFIGFLALAATASAAQADPTEGVWQTQAGDEGGYLQVAIAPCGDVLCGTIVQAFDADGAASPDYEHLGKTMLWDMQVAGGGAYKGGRIWAPDSDKTYGSKMQLDGAELTVKGCVAGGLVCRGQVWSKVD